MPTPRYGYTLADGSPIPGATSVMGALTNGSVDPLLFWAAKLAREGKDWKVERERSAQVGTFLHDVVEKKKLPDPRPLWVSAEEWNRAEVLLREYEGWLAGVKAEVVSQEEQLVSEEQRFGGTYDQLYLIHGEHVLGDVKTGKTIDVVKVSMQLGAYRHLLQVNKGITCRRAVVLHFSGLKFRPVELSWEQLDAGWELFKVARQAYDLFRGFPR